MTTPEPTPTTPELKQTQQSKDALNVSLTYFEWGNTRNYNITLDGSLQDDEHAVAFAYELGLTKREFLLGVRTANGHNAPNASRLGRLADTWRRSVEPKERERWRRISFAIFVLLSLAVLVRLIIRQFF